MDNRLTLHDIAALLAEHSGKSVPDSELFLQELIQSIVGNLFVPDDLDIIEL